MTNEELVALHPEPTRPVVVTEVTQMSQAYYCVAGWDAHHERMVRPLQQSGTNWKAPVVGSVFAVGHVVDCSPTGQAGPIFPHATEDFRIRRAPEVLRALEESELYELLLPYTVTTVADLFARSLDEGKYVPNGTRCPSLGGLRVPRNRVSFAEFYGRLRLSLRDEDGATFFPAVTCDHLRRLFTRVDEEAEASFGVAEANEWLAQTPAEAPLIVRLGLARGWSGPDRSWVPHRCYLQANGVICPEDNYHALGLHD